MPMDYSWKVVICPDAEAVRNTVGKPESFRSWEMESSEYLQEVLSGLPSSLSEKIDLSGVSWPAFLCIWADSNKIE